MVEANELRVGNLVHRNDYVSDLFQIRSISQDRIHAINVVEIDVVNNTIYSSDCTLSELEPIPLTEEWLLKFGFSVSDQPSWNVYEIGEWFILLMEKRDTKIILGALADNIPDVEIKFVHQLQNLYFALTGAELPIK